MKKGSEYIIFGYCDYGQNKTYWNNLENKNPKKVQNIRKHIVGILRDNFPLGFSMDDSTKRWHCSL